MPFRSWLPWLLVALYTLSLPSVILVYRQLENVLGFNLVQWIPLMVILFFGIAYTGYGFHRNNNFRHLFYLIPCVILCGLVFYFEDNPNKRIHIPEYVLMTGLLFFAFIQTHQGKGIYCMIFICGVLLGTVDELQQGMHPLRYYGASDMLVNSAGITIGILLIAGLRQNRQDFIPEPINIHSAGLWLFFLAAFGLISSLLILYFLFDVKSSQTFHNTYPKWLYLTNWIYLFTFPLVLVLYQKHIRDLQHQGKKEHLATLINTEHWLLPLICIQQYMHILLIAIALTGIAFK